MLTGSLLLPAFCAAPSLFWGRQSDAPYAVVLGTAQDAGVPQANCFTANCEAVRLGRRPAPRVASLGLVDPVSRERFLIDATPDFVAQVGDLLTHPEGGERPSGSLRLEEHLHGILLTHGHMGHYTGLPHVGREAGASRGLPLYGSRRMLEYLQSNEPWAFLFRNAHLSGVELRPGARIQLTDSLSVTPVDVVHRQEFTDTLAFLVHGPERSLLYVPDADRWEGWPVPLENWLDQADVALLDGSFYSYDELGHRPQGDIPHPPVSTTIELLGGRADRPEIWFTHLNNTNPLWDPESPENQAVREAGFGVATLGQIIVL